VSYEWLLEEDDGFRLWPHRFLPGEVLLSLEPLLFGAWRLHVIRGNEQDVYDFSPVGMSEDDVRAAAFVALHRWDGVGEPVGWYRHRKSDRRRPGGDPTREEVRP
jgi:hypothetical protein